MDLVFDQSGRLRAGWRFCLGALVFAAAEVVGSAAGSLVWEKHLLLGQLIVQAFALAILLGGFAFLLMVVDHVEGRPLASMGLGWGRRTFSQAAAGLSFGCGMIAVCTAVVLARSDVTMHARLSEATALRGAIAVAVLALGAMAEEAAFRGYPFQRLVDAAGPLAAILIIQVCFGLVHARNPNVSRWAIANTVLFGVLLAIVYLRSRSLWIPWGIHFGWNALLAIGLGLPLSGLTLFGVIVHARARGPQWITGGDYGIEGGALATVVIIAATPLAWWIAGRLATPPASAGHQQAVEIDPESRLERI